MQQLDCSEQMRKENEEKCVCVCVWYVVCVVCGVVCVCGKFTYITHVNAGFYNHCL